ncbi:MAG TPA: glycosyltransferase family 87 protein [Candidatus Dormibacteraeota bacterium]
MHVAEPGGRGGGLLAWLPSLPLASAIVALAVFMAWSVAAYGHVVAIAGARGTDFAQYYVAARLTLAHGWTAPYDVVRYMTALRAYTGQSDAYANLPPPTLLVMPLTRLPLGIAYGVWNAILVSGFAVACWAAAPGRGWARVAQLLASLVAFQVLSAIALGQLALAVGALLVLHWWLLRRDRPILAGIVLGLAFVKPQNVVLAPLALLLSGRWRTAAASTVTAAALGAACLLALGPGGVQMYLRTVAFELRHQPAGHFTLTAVLGGVLPWAAVAVAPLALVVLVALDRRDHQPERPLVAAVLASHLASPYLNGADLALLTPCAWLTLRSSTPGSTGPAQAEPWWPPARWIGWTAVALNVLPVYPQGSGMPVVTVSMQLVWLAALAAPAAGGALTRAFSAPAPAATEE